MAKIFRPNNKESILLSRIESSKERDRRLSIRAAKDHSNELSNSVAMKLVELKYIETTSKNSLQEQLLKKLDEIAHADDFDVDYQIAPFRTLVSNPNIVSIYLTAFVIETLINHKDVIDIYGSDEEIYHCINSQTKKYLQD